MSTFSLFLSPPVALTALVAPLARYPLSLLLLSSLPLANRWDATDTTMSWQWAWPGGGPGLAIPLAAVLAWPGLTAIWLWDVAPRRDRAARLRSGHNDTARYDASVSWHSLLWHRHAVTRLAVTSLAMLRGWARARLWLLNVALLCPIDRILFFKIQIFFWNS